MNFREVIIILLLAGTGSMTGQTVSIGEFFSRNIAPLPQATEPGRRPLRSPLIEAFDLRTETERFEPARQEYTGRLKFTSPALARARRALSDELNRRPDTERDENICDQAEALYVDWAALYFSHHRGILLDSLLAVMHDHRKVLDARAVALRLEPGDLVAFHENLTEVELARHENSLQSALTLQRNAISDERPDYAGFPSPTTLPLIVQEAFSASVTTSREDLHDLALIERELAIERAEGRQILDFLQFKYAGNPNENFESKFSLGMALRIQNDGGRYLKIRELELEKELAESKMRRKAILTTTKRAAAGEYFTNQRAIYGTTVGILRHEDNALARLAGRLAGSEATDPKLMLRVAARRLELKLMELDAYEDLVKAYLRGLRQSGALCAGTDGRWLRAERSS